jgi:hypothetical protein
MLTCLSTGILQYDATAVLRWATVSRARFVSRLSIQPVSTRNMYSILTAGCHSGFTKSNQRFHRRDAKPSRTS